MKAAQNKGETGRTGAVVARGEVHRQATSCSDVFHKGSLPKGDADFEHCGVVIFYRELEANSDCGLVKIMNLRRVLIHFCFHLRCSVFTNRSQVSLRRTSQPAFLWRVLLVSYFLQTGKPRLREVNQLPGEAACSFQMWVITKSICFLDHVTHGSSGRQCPSLSWKPGGIRWLSAPQWGRSDRVTFLEGNSFSLTLSEPFILELSHRAWRKPRLHGEPTGRCCRR